MNLRPTLAATLLLGSLALSLAFAGQTPTTPDVRLLEAAARGDLKDIRAALAAGANANARDKDGKTVLEIVSYGGLIYDHARTTEEIDARLRSVKLLVERGAKITGTTDEHFPFYLVHSAFYEGRYALAEFLLARGGDPSALNLWYVMRQPRFPVKKPHALRRRLFEQALARAEKSPKSQPLVEAAVSDDGVYFTRRLLEAGYNPNVRDYLGMTPLLTAINKDRPEIVALLLKYQADVNQKYEKPASPYVVFVGAIENKTPLRIARERNRTKIVTLLEKAGAKE
jgi:uncharacterized protein